MKRYIALIILLACAPAEEPPATRSQPEAVATPVVSYPVITADGIGAARRGMTVGEVRAALPAGSAIGSLDELFMVDLSALPVVAGTDTLYHLVFVHGDPVSDTTHVQMVVTTHPRVTTPEGVGPGSTVEEAASRYGQPTLSYNTNDESREYAKFPNYSAGNVWFRLKPGDGDAFFVGKYGTDGEYNETTTFDPAGRILMVMVDVQRR
jgi:hypothetical protein